MNSRSLAIVWGKWGPYHLARFQALREFGLQMGWTVTGVQYSSGSRDYAWEASLNEPGLYSIEAATEETRWDPPRLAVRWHQLQSVRNIDVLLTPSYWHWSLHINLQSRLQGARIVMMNDTHALTQKATGWKRALKSLIVRSFHAAFVAGTPQVRYFASLGLPRDRIFTGYDCIDNEGFALQADAARADAEAVRRRLNLPNSYLLSLGRLVPKKNLETLMRAYAALPAGFAPPLLIVGSGPEEARLRELASLLGLTITPVDDCPRTGEVNFYGFCPNRDTAAIYALASAFILPSLEEEWGLVVNEAMACGCPVLVSDRAGCCEDLVADGVNGFVFDPSDADSIASVFRRFLDASPEKKSEMGIASRRRISAWDLHCFASNAIRAAEFALQL